MTTITSLRNLADWLLRGSFGVAIGRAALALFCMLVRGQACATRVTRSARETALSQRQIKVGTGRLAEASNITPEELHEQLKLANNQLAEAERMVKHQERLILVVKTARLSSERAEVLLASFRVAQTAIAAHQEQLQQHLERSAQTAEANPPLI